MGLDMYLYKEKYFSEFRKNLPKVEGFEDCESMTIKGEAIYWRKANAIHQWFVEKVQKGRDNCGNYRVSTDQLRDLLRDVNIVLGSTQLVAGKVRNGQTLKEGGWEDIIEDGEIVDDTLLAERVLPTQDGFFFGGTDYDEYYYRDLEHTKKRLDELLNSPDVEDYDYSYHSSW